MQTNDAGLLFQTSTDLKVSAAREKKLKAAEKVGNPIRTSSKVLDFVIEADDAFVAESGWQIRQVDLKTGVTKRLFRGHQGPVTSVALLRTKDDFRLFSGSWDKTIRVWNVKTGEVICTLEGHSDFVKSLLLLDLARPLLLSTSSDRTLRLWDLSPLESNSTPTCVQTIRDHTRPVEASTWRAFVSELGEDMGTLVWTADSLGTIKQWELREGRLVYVKDLRSHETSVGSVHSTEEGLWSVSMDKSALFHPSDNASSNSTANVHLPHDGYVKSVATLPATSESPALVLTAGDDEDIYVWKADDVLEGQKSTPIKVPGHCAEIGVLRVWRPTGGGEVVIVSGSLDSTLRRWTILELLQPAPLLYDEEPENTGVELTEDEERELAELMDDD